MAFPNLLQLFLNGLGLSAFYALFAVGLTLVFGVMRIINFAHGELYMLGAYLVYFVFNLGQDQLTLLPLFFAGLLVAMAGVSLLSLVIERAIFRPLRKNPINCFMASVGVLYILQVSAGQIFGIKQKSLPSFFPGEIRFAGAALSIRILVTIIIAIVLLGLLWFFLEKTRLGRGIRACAQDGEAAALQGININRMSALVMGLGGALAAASGAVVGTSYLINPYMGWLVLWKAFIVTIVGGMGSIPGALVASLLFGFLDSLISSLGNPRMEILIDVTIMLVVLAYKPKGILGIAR